MNDFKELGDIRELYVAQKLIEREFKVCFPYSNERYDLLAEKYPKFIRIQVKPLAKEQDSKIEKWRIGTNSNRNSYSKQDTDLIWAVDLQTNYFAIIPIEEAEGTVVYISEHNTSKRRKYLNSYAALDAFND